MPVDYCETKRRKKSEAPASNAIQPIQVKLEQIDRMRQTIGVLNDKLGIEEISDDDESDSPIIDYVAIGELF